MVGADGRFSVANVPATLGTTTLIARLTEGGVQLISVIDQLPIHAGGISDAGILTVTPVQNPGSEIPDKLLYPIPAPPRWAHKSLLNWAEPW